MADTDRERQPQDFAIEITFTPGVGDPTRIFRSAIALIESMGRLDHELVRGLDAGIRTSIRLEQIEEGSLRIWLRTFLESLDDDALKSGDWKKVVGNYLFISKYKLLEYLRGKESLTQDVSDLQALSESIQRDAEETGIKEIPVYVVPTRTFLILEILHISVALSPLRPDDRVILLDESGRTIEFNTRLQITQADVDALVTERLPSEPNEAVLLVKKPVFLGESRWEFVYQGHAIEAKMLDTAWVEEFRKHRIQLEPGSSLAVSLRTENSYNAEERAVNPKHFVLKVHRVIPPADIGFTSSLFLR